MAEPLKNQYGVQVIDQIAAMFEVVAPQYEWHRFRQRARSGYAELELMQRARHIADTLAATLPASFPQASELLIRSLGPAHEVEQGTGMAGFVYLPHCLFVAHYGIEDFDAGMRANYELTKRFTAEFSIRPFVERYPQQCLQMFEQWVSDRNVHVRRLVSEGTRPRLPWAGRLRAFEKCPELTLRLLERLRDDEHEYVRRSVANHLNDIGKEHPDLLIDVCRRWAAGADQTRKRLISRALRTLVKQGRSDALAILGFADQRGLEVSGCKIAPKRVAIGESLAISFVVHNKSRHDKEVLIDLKVSYRKADGTASPKVFKLKNLRLMAGDRVTLNHRLSLKQLSTRTHHPGLHGVEALVNGRLNPIGTFMVRVADS